MMLVTDLHMRSICNEYGLQYYLNALDKIHQYKSVLKEPR